MKKIIFLPLFGFLATINVHAQADYAFAENDVKTEVSLSKSKLSLAQLKAEADFLKNNPRVTSVRWYDDPKGYFVYYLKEGKRARTFYNTKGNFVYSAMSYSEKELTQPMKTWILSSFDEKMKITHVNEIHQDAKTIYLVTVTDDKVWKKLRIEGEEMEVIDGFKAG
jgi:hypothetical protein